MTVNDQIDSLGLKLMIMDYFEFLNQPIQIFCLISLFLTVLIQMTDKND